MTRLHLPIVFELMEIVINYLYSDTAAPLLGKITINNVHLVYKLSEVV